MNIKSMIRRGLMPPEMGIGVVEHPLVAEAEQKLKGAAAKPKTTKKKTAKKTTKKSS
tara:strand:- start:175 stop:345 length:171 start_codon:yes stop_codon:yes gene_type:complete